jgi:hypothetical protein
MKSLTHRLLVVAFVATFSGCATVPPPEVEELTLDIPTYMDDTLRVSYRPARELQFGNMTCLLDQKLTPLNSGLEMAVACNESRQSGVSVTLGWKRTGYSRNEIEEMVSRNMRLRSRLGPPEESVKDQRVCEEQRVEILIDKGVLVRCRVNFSTNLKNYKVATFSVFYLKPQESLNYQPFVVTEGAFGRGDEEAQRDAILYGDALSWAEKK